MKLNSKNIHQFYDKTYTKLFSHKRMADDLIKGFVHTDFAKDIEIIEKLNSKFITKKYRKYESDVIYKARFKEKDLIIFILLEFQSKNQKFMAVRLLNYLSLFYLDYIKQNPKITVLPPILPIVIHIGNDKFTDKTNFNELVNQPYKSFKRYIPDFNYLLIDLQNLPKQSLDRLAVHSKNIAGLLFRIDQYNEEELSKNLQKVITILKQELPDEVLTDFEEYLTAIISEDQKEQQEIINTITKEPSMLYYTIKKMREKDRKEGIKEGIKEGKQAGMFTKAIETARNALKKGLSIDLIAELTGLPINKINKLKTN